MKFSVQTARGYIILLITIVALATRLPGFSWGLQTFDRFATKATYHPDEPKVVEGAKGFPADYLQREDLRYPTAMHYVSGTMMLPFRGNMVIYQPQFFNDLYFLGTRFVSLIHSLVAILLTYILGRKLMGESGGLIAMGFMAVGVYHARSASLGTVDGMTSAWLAACILLAFRLETSQRWLDFLALGAAVGILVGTKYNGAIVILLIGIIVIQYLLRVKERSQRIRMMVGLCLSGFVSILVFFLITPAALINWQGFIHSLLYESTRVGREILPLWHPGVWLAFFSTTIQATGFPIAVFSVLGFLLSFRKAGWKLLPLSILVIVYYYYFRNSLLPRYLVTIFPLLCLFAAYFFSVIFSSSHQGRRIVGWSLLVLTFAYGFYQGILLNDSLRHDTRSSAARYISAEIPTGSTIGLFGHEDELWRFPKIDSDLIVMKATDKPDYLISSSFDYSSEEAKQMLASNDSLYELIAEFTPKWNLVIEFVSPVIRVYNREDGS